MTLPEPPSDLTERSCGLWSAVLADHELSPAELEVLRCALVALDRADQAALVVRDEGVTTIDRYGSPKAHPAVDVESRNRALFARLVVQLNIKLTEPSAASSRARHAAQARWKREGSR